MQRALARVNLAAITRNARRLRERLGESELCAVVKADGYGHGAAEAGRAAVAAGVRWLAVATAGEAAELRDAGIAERILIMGAISSQELPQAIAARADVVAWSKEFLASVLAASTPSIPVAVHVKLDSGMGRLGTRDVAEALDVARAVVRDSPRVVLAGAMTHLATADEDLEFMGVQLARFAEFAGAVRELAPDVLVHAANSAAVLRDPGSHFDMARCGIALYGCDPMNRDPAQHHLEPALELCSYLAAVKLAAPGDSAGYGRSFIASEQTWIGTAPIGYADGVSRGLSNRAEVLVGGRRHRLAGTVSMDNVTVDLGPSTEAKVGDRVVLIGVQDGERVTAEELAGRLGTINYEIVTGISARVPRIYHRDGEAAS